MGIQVTFLDQTGAKSVRAKISPTVKVKQIVATVIIKMSMPSTAPDGQPMSYSLDWKEGGKRLKEDETLADAGVREGDHLIVYPEIVAGVRGGFGQRVRTLRNARGLTLDQVAKAAKISKGYLSGIENEKVNAPAPSVVRGIARALHADVKELLLMATLEKAPEEIQDDLKRAVHTV